MQSIARIVSATILCLSTCYQLQSQDASDTTTSVLVDEVVVTATRSLSNTDNLPVNIAVVNQRQIVEEQPMTPVEALQYIPGVVRQSDGGLASTPIIRGLSRERAPLLIDGNAFVGGRIRSYSLVDPFQMQQIEVIKGSASAFWGSDAVSGLVNIVTRKAENGYGKDFKMGGSLYGGYQSVSDFYRGRIELEGRGGGFDFLVGGGLREASNTMTPDGEIENSQFESVNFDFNIGYSWAENHHVEVSGKYYKNENVGFPGGLGAPGPPNVTRLFNPDEQLGLNFAYDGTNISDKVAAIGARLFFKKQDLHIDQITQVFFPMTDNVNRLIDVMLDVDVPFMGSKLFATLNQQGGHKLTVGLDFLNEHRIGTHRDLNVKIFNPLGDLVNEIDPPYMQIQPDSYSRSFGAFAIEEMHFGEKLDLMAAARIDNVSTKIDDGPFGIEEIEDIFNGENNSDSDWAISGNLGLKYRLNANFNVTANLANSFRGTDLFSKYHFTSVGTGFLIPNPELDPERGVFYELGAQFRNRTLKVEVNFYQNFLRELFVLTDVEFNGTPSVQFQNVGEATITGLEWNAQVRFGTLSYVFVRGALINGTNEIEDEPLPAIPAPQTWVGVHYRNRNDKFFVQPEVLFVGDQEDIAPNEIETPGYTVFNLKTGANMHRLIDAMPHLKLIFSVTNLTDEAYRSHVSRGAPGNQNTFLEPGISFNLGLVMRLGIATDN